MDPEEKDVHPTLSNMDIKYPMLAFEKQIFMDIFENDALLILAKGINYNTVLLNLLSIYKDPSSLVLVMNGNEHEDKFISEKCNLSPLPITDREKAYLEGGIRIVSSRVLVVDLLKDRVPVSHITGIIVLRAHTILESCQEAFALRLYRQKNKTGFIKGFSNSPISFTFGYHQVEKVMRALFVKELFLWPRFHGTIIKSLKTGQTSVIELYVPLTASMNLIQTCLLDIMNYTVKQLKSTNRTLDMQEVTTENCLTKKFHKILQSQLDCVWHQLSNRTKEYIQDLKVLRSMIIKLIHEDSVSFNSLVSQYRTPEYAKVTSGWILLDSAEQLFRLARGRVFNGKNEFDPEPCPKWKYLSDLLLKEIPEEVKKKQNGSLINTKIVILCQDNRTCNQINSYLTMGANKYLFYTAMRKQVTINAVSAKFKDCGPVDISKCDGKAEIKVEEDEEEDKSNYLLTLTQLATDRPPDNANDSMFEPITQIENLDMTQIELEKPIICIQTFKENGNHFSLENTLEALRPEYIILYHGDVSAVRQIELFECRKKPGEVASQVYFLMHDQTVEEQAYLTSLKREKQAFELLIRTKSTMVVPTYQDGKTDEYFELNVEEEDDAVDTRKAGGAAPEVPLVVVDAREFRCELPALLHRARLRVLPAVITVGDYILSPDICVERKSISDLIGSLRSGRLYTQCTQMCRNYTRPILLIEFDQNKPFNLQGNFVVSSDMSGADIQQRLQLLTIHFPRLKIVWSPSPYATAELFAELKQGRKNPSVSEATALGENPAEEMYHERYNAAVHDFVQRLPGVTSRNRARLMNTARSMDHLITLTTEELTAIMGNKSDAEALYTILHVKPATEFKDDRGKRKFTSKYKKK